jgi:predicted GNAT family acetyltransferase
MTTEVVENPAKRRYEILIDGTIAGFTQYQQVDRQTWEFFHTEVDPAFEGQGLASQLIEQTLDDLRKRAIAVLPTCPFVRGFLDKHPDYAAMVPTSERQRFGLAVTPDAGTRGTAGSAE